MISWSCMPSSCRVYKPLLLDTNLASLCSADSESNLCLFLSSLISLLLSDSALLSIFWTWHPQTLLVVSSFSIPFSELLLALSFTFLPSNLVVFFCFFAAQFWSSVHSLHFLAILYMHSIFPPGLDIRIYVIYILPLGSQ